MLVLLITITCCYFDSCDSMMMLMMMMIAQTREKGFCKRFPSGTSALIKVTMQEFCFLLQEVLEVLGEPQQRRF